MYARNMSKKEFLIKVLEYIWDSWELGNALLILLKNDELNDEMMTKLINIMDESLKTVEDEQAREKIRRWIQLLKDREENDQMETDKEITSIENLLDNM